MTSLSEAYGARGQSDVSLRRLYLGVGLFVAGVLLVVAGILTAGTDLVASMEGYSLADARLYGGVLGGIGVPMTLLGTFTVLPSGRTTKAIAVVGAAVCVLGVAMFYHAYPCGWIGAVCAGEYTDLTLPTAGVYFLGAATSFWALFVGVANFKTRNDPGGTVTMEVTHKGETKIVEVDRNQLGGLGGVGLLGGTPDGEVETQTGGTASGGEAVDPRDDGSTVTRSRDRGSVASPSVSDGGADAEAVTSPLDDGPETTQSAPEPSAVEDHSPSSKPVEPAPPSMDGPGDRYCGNCESFDYVRTSEGMQPYCGHHDALMDDMDACDEWSPR